LHYISLTLSRISCILHSYASLLLFEDDFCAPVNDCLYHFLFFTNFTTATKCLYHICWWVSIFYFPDALCWRLCTLFPPFCGIILFLWCIYDCPMYFIYALTGWIPVFVWTMAATLVDLIRKIHRWERTRPMQRVRRESPLNEWLPKYVVCTILHGSITSSRPYHEVNGLCIRYHITLCGFCCISSVDFID
jgi:hypothetical protein